MWWSQLEGEAERLYRSVGCDPSEAVSPTLLARKLLGPGRVLTARASALPGDAVLARVYGEPRIYVRSKLTAERSRFAVAHELAHWALGDAADGDELERLCDALAAALIAPRRAFQSALRESGHRFAPIARWFVTTESCAALRLGEVTGRPLALVTPRLVRVRGDEWGWPPEPEIRQLARAKRLPGVRRAKLRDDPRRVALVAKGA